MSGEGSSSSPSSPSSGGPSRPKSTYVQLVRDALLEAPDNSLTLQEIYQTIEEKHEYYKLVRGKGWKNSLRHCLSITPCFKNRVRPFPDPGKGGYWYIDHTQSNSFSRVRNRRRSRADVETDSSARSDDVILVAGKRKREADEGGRRKGVQSRATRVRKDSVDEDDGGDGDGGGCEPPDLSPENPSQDGLPSGPSPASSSGTSSLPSIYQPLLKPFQPPPHSFGLLSSNSYPWPCPDDETLYSSMPDQPCSSSRQTPFSSAALLDRHHLLSSLQPSASIDQTQRPEHTERFSLPHLDPHQPPPLDPSRSSTSSASSSNGGNSSPEASFFPAYHSHSQPYEHHSSRILQPNASFLVASPPGSFACLPPPLPPTIYEPEPPPNSYEPGLSFSFSAATTDGSSSTANKLPCLSNLASQGSPFPPPQPLSSSPSDYYRPYQQPNTDLHPTTAHRLPPRLRRLSPTSPLDLTLSSHSRTQSCQPLPPPSTESSFIPTYQQSAPRPPPLVVLRSHPHPLDNTARSGSAVGREGKDFQRYAEQQQHPGREQSEEGGGRRGRDMYVQARTLSDRSSLEEKAWGRVEG